MKNLYEIKDKKGLHLCYQVGATEADAVHTDRVYYGHKTASQAVFVRVN